MCGPRMVERERRERVWAKAAVAVGCSTSGSALGRAAQERGGVGAREERSMGLGLGLSCARQREWRVWERVARLGYQRARVRFWLWGEKKRPGLALVLG